MQAQKFYRDLKDEKKYLILIIVVAMIGILGICVSCCNIEKPQPQMPQPTSECRIDDFQQLKSIFPHKILLPAELGNEEIAVRFDEYSSESYWRDLIRKNEKINLITGAAWEKRYTDYTIKVFIFYQENFTIPEDLLQTFKEVETEINGYRVYQEKANISIFVEDRDINMYYFIAIDEIIDLTLEQRDSIVKNYFNSMCRV